MISEQKVRVETPYGVKNFQTFHFQKHAPIMLKKLAKKIFKKTNFDLWDWDGKHVYAKYNTFKVYNNGENFSTYDANNDGLSCSRDYRGAWWYWHCHISNLNGEYRWFDEKQPGFARGVIWHSYKNSYEYSLKGVEMKVRRKL